MLRGRSSHESVFVCVCLFVLLTQSSPRKFCSKDFFAQVKALNETLNQTGLNFSLYTPTIQDYQKCPSVALKCFADELEVLNRELEISGVKRSPLFKTLQRLEKNEKQSDCLRCELLEERSAEIFLQNLQDTVQEINAKNCQITAKKS
uniref:Interleukin n=1 Tax=Kryptolebias marmoratus TaxID=37003 RepID=A0A3Q3A3W9_KRYMA